MARLGAAVFALLLVRAIAGAAPGDPTLPGPYDVGHGDLLVARTATLDGPARTLDPIVWYPADVAGEPRDAYGYVEPAVAKGRRPILVYSHGGCAYPEVSSFLTMALASWGFIVVAPRHPGDTVFDGIDVCDLVELRGPTLIERVDDVKVVLDALLAAGRERSSPFFRRLARSRVGVLGWSSGASTAIVAGRDDRRIRGVLSLAPDARPERIGTEALRAATMVMVGELDYYDPQQTSLAQVYDFLRAPRFAAHLVNTGHFAFSDPCIEIPGGVDCRPGALTQDQAHRVVLRFAVPFLLRYVAGTKAWGALLRPETVNAAEATLQAEPRRGRR